MERGEEQKDEGGEREHKRCGGRHRQQATALPSFFFLTLNHPFRDLFLTTCRTKPTHQVYSHDPEGNEIVAFATGTDANRTATSSSDFKLGFKLVMQPDHDLVLLSDSGEVIWRTDTVGKGMGGGETVYAALDDAGVLHGERGRW